MSNPSDQTGTESDANTDGKRARERADARTGKPIDPAPQKPGEVGGSDKPEPTRFGDWEVNGRCSDF